MTRVLQRTDVQLALLVVLAMALHAAFVIRGFGEPDAVRLVLAALEWHATGQAIDHSYIYRTSPLTIHGVKILLDLGFPASKLAPFLNWSQAIVASLGLIPLFLLWRKLSGAATAWIGCVLVLFAPAHWLASIYGMPHLPSFTLLVVGLWLFAEALDHPSRRWALLATSTIAAFLCLGFKADMVLCMGAFLGVAVAREKVARANVLASVAIPLVAFAALLAYSKALSPSMPAAARFAVSWSEQFPFTWRAVTEVHNRDVLIQSMGRAFALLVLAATLYCLALRRHLRLLAFSALWALPPILFWGMKLGNSARHMMSAAVALLFVGALVLSARIPRARWRVVALVLLVALNHLLGPSQGSSILPTSRLLALTRSVQNYADILHEGGKAFAALPVPAKKFAGSPAAPYAVFEVIAPARELQVQRIQPGAARGAFDPEARWPLYQVTTAQGVVQKIGVIEVSPGPGIIGPEEDWYLFSSEPDIRVANLMDRWRPHFMNALEADPTSAEAWTHNTSLRIQAGIAFVEIDHPNEAIQMFEQALAVEPNSADALFGAALVYLKLRQIDKGRMHLRTFLRLHPDDSRSEMAKRLLEG